MKKFLAGMTFLALLMGAYFLGKREATSNVLLDHNTQTDVESPSAATPAIQGFDKKKNGSLQNNLPLPLANIPLSEVYDLLQMRADAGDGKAACRLAIELLRCRHSKNASKYFLDQSADMSLLETNDSPKDKLSSQNAMDERRLEILEKNKSCQNISDDQYKQVFKYLRQAAYAGESDALVPYIEGVGLGNDLSFIRGRGGNFDAWRSDALPLTQLALQQGLPESVVFLSSGYAEDLGLFSALLEDDPYQAEVMRQLYFQLFSITPTPLDSHLTIEQNQRALLKSKELFANNFHGKVIARIEASKRVRSTMSLKKDEKAPCE